MEKLRVILRVCGKLNQIEKRYIWSLLNIDIVWILYAFIGGDWANRRIGSEKYRKNETRHT